MKRVQKGLTLAEKITILDKAEKLCATDSLRKMSFKLNVPVSTLAKIMKEKNQLRLQFANDPGCENKRMRVRNGKDPLVEEALKKWFQTMTSRGVVISGPILLKKAKDFAISFGHNEFEPTIGWLSRWKSRNSIVYKKAHGEKGSADEPSASKWLAETLPAFLESYSPENIYNADETGLFYRATPNGSLVFDKQNIVGSKKMMSRLTLLCCVNMAGTDKKRLLAIGNSAKPRAFKNVKQLPVDYHANKKAWMTSEIFKTWITKWDRTLKKKILLVVDNCTVHSPPEN